MTAAEVADECTDSDFDIEAALKEFLADPTRTEMQLPHMTTGQRKQAKKLADEYPEIKCESYGFGPERKLHLFKPDPNKPTSPKAPSPKKDSEGEAAGRVSRTSSNRSTDASGPPSPEATESSPTEARSADLIRVRNTFIHFEDKKADERVVQSMPHGMFSQCLLEESQKTSGAAEPAPKAASPPPPAAEAPKDIFAPGSEVVIEGLTKCPAFNGLHGTVQSLDAESGRYSVLLVSHDGSAGQSAKIKGENLRLTVPPPPPFESTAQRPEETTALPPPARPREISPMACLGQPAMPALPPGAPTWQDHQMVQPLPVPQPMYEQPPPIYDQSLQQPLYDPGFYDPNAYAMMYPAR